MEVKKGESLSISELNGQNSTERKTIAPGTYEAEYKGLKIAMEKTKPEWGINGQRKVVRLLFKIVRGPFKGQVTSYKGAMFANSDGTWVVGSKSKLADQIKVITGGSATIDDTFKGKLFFVDVSNSNGKPQEDGTVKVYDQVDKFLAKPVDEETAAPAQSVASAKPAASATAVATAPVAAAPAKTNSGLMDDLTSLGDFA